MALKDCAECGKPVSTEAKSCPNCGAKPPKKTSAFTWIVLGLIVFGVIGKMGSMGGSDVAPSATAIASPPVATAPPEPEKPAPTEKERAAHAKKLDAEARATAKAERKRKRSEGVSIGMTKADALSSSWGIPRKVNATTNSRGTREQWVYDGGYLYFQDGILTTIQN